MPFTSENAQALGAKGGASKANRKLSLDRVERELPPLDSYESAQQRLATVSNWLCAGLLSGTAGHAFVRCHEIWLKAAESRLSADLVEGLRKRLDDLESQLKHRRAVL